MRDGQSGEGCSLSGSVVVPRVPATLRFVPARRDDAPRPDVLPALHVRHALYLNVSHRLRHLSFGTYFPGQTHPLDGTERTFANGTAEARYMIHVVPTSYHALNRTVLHSSLFSVTEHARPLHWESAGAALPGVFLSYDISSLKVELTEARGASVLRSVARICALVGGVHTVAGMVDKVVYYSTAFVQKQRMGKLS
jgi:hypothetical protein